MTNKRNNFIFVVVIMGLLVLAYYFLPRNKEIPIQNELEEQKDMTADWKIYTNEKYGFEFKYPDNLSLVDSVNYDHPVFKAVLGGEAEYEMHLDIEKYDEPFHLGDQTFIAKRWPGALADDFTIFQVDGVDAAGFYFFYKGEEGVIFYRNGYIYIFDFKPLFSGDDSSLHHATTLYEPMFSTFKFTK